MSYPCNLFFLLIFIFIIIDRIISWIQTQLVFFAYFLEHIVLFLENNADEECEKISNSKSSASRCCLAFAWFFANFILALLMKVLPFKKACIFSKSKSSASRCCLAFAWFFANFSLTLFIKVLLVKKHVYFQRDVRTWSSDQIINAIYFCVGHNNRRKHNQHFNLLFFKINLVFGSQTTSALGKIIVLPINSIYLN